MIGVIYILSNNELLSLNLAQKLLTISNNFLNIRLHNKTEQDNTNTYTLILAYFLSIVSGNSKIE